MGEVPEVGAPAAIGEGEVAETPPVEAAPLEKVVLIVRAAAPLEEVDPIVEAAPLEEVVPVVEAAPLEEVVPVVEATVRLEEVDPIAEAAPLEEVVPVVEATVQLEAVDPIVEAAPLEEVVPVVEAAAPLEAPPPEETAPPPEGPPPSAAELELMRRVEALAAAVGEAKSDRERKRRLEPLRVAAYAGFEPAAAALRGLSLTPPAPGGPHAEPFLTAIPGGKVSQVVAACAVARAVILIARRAVKAGWLEQDAASLALEAAEGWLDSPSGQGELATRDAAELAQEAHEKKLNSARLKRVQGDVSLEAGYATRAAELAARAAHAPSEDEARVALLTQLLPASQALINPDFRLDSPERQIAIHVVQRDWILPAVKSALIEWALRPREGP